MFNKKSTNTPLLLRNCASKNSLKTLFKVNAQAKISHSKGVFVLFLLSIWVQFVCFIFFCFMMQKYAVVEVYLWWQLKIFDDFRIFWILAYVWDFSVTFFVLIHQLNEVWFVHRSSQFFTNGSGIQGRSIFFPLFFSL